jgi:hypothetical protein
MTGTKNNDFAAVERKDQAIKDKGVIVVPMLYPTKKRL